MHRARVFVCLVFLASVLVAAVWSPSTAAHERKEVAGMMVVFGAETEPAITEEKQQLVWRFLGLESEAPVGTLEELDAVVVHDETEYGPFMVFGSRREPGTYSTTHIFTAGGEYAVTLHFGKPGETERHAVEFDFNIGDRADLEIPARGGHLSQ